MPNIEENMRIYDAVRAVPQEAKKQFNNGRFSGTDINPMWRIKTLTEQFGASGIGWYTRQTDRWCEVCGDTVMAFVNIELYVKVGGEWSMPIFGTGGNLLINHGKFNDEAFKMAYTDAISVAAKALGIGADVYFEKDTSSKYASSYTDNQAQTSTAPKSETRKPTPPYRTLDEELQAKKKWLMANLPDELMGKAIASFGNDFGKMTLAQADKLIERVKAA